VTRAAKKGVKHWYNVPLGSLQSRFVRGELDQVPQALAVLTVRLMKARGMNPASYTPSEARAWLEGLRQDA